MKLNATITDISRDKERGVLISGDIKGGGFFHKWANVDGLRLDDELTVIVLSKDNARGLFIDLENLFKEAEHSQPLVMYAIALRDQLRPDPPPPFLEEVAADTNVYDRGGHGIQTNAEGPLP